MKKSKCPNCGYELGESSYFCVNCGGVVDDKLPLKDNDKVQLFKRIVSNLDEIPHYDVIWNDTIDKYVTKVERIEALLGIKDCGVNSSDLQKRISEFLDLCRKPEFQIAFVGTVKTGKSTLINALLGRNYSTMDVTPETACLSKFRSSEKDYIKVIFYTTEEWKNFRLLLEKSCNDLSDEIDSSCMYFRREYDRLQADKEKKRWIGHKEIKVELANEDIEEEMKKWCSSKSPIHFFVKEIEVGISTLGSDFPKQIVFVDTPGLSDPVEYRSELSKEYIHKANAVFVCIDATKIYKDEIETIASVFSFSAHNKDKVHIVATHWDTLNEPENHWKRQKEHLVNLLTGDAYFESAEKAEKNITYAAAYIANLCRDYKYLNEVEKRFLIPFAAKMNLDFLLSDETLQQMKDLSNVEHISVIIKNELVSNYAELLFGDIQNNYNNILYIVHRKTEEKKKDYLERLADCEKDINTLLEKVSQKDGEKKAIEASQKQLQAAINSIRTRTEKRLEKIRAKIK